MNMATARICALAGLLSVCGVGLLLAPSWGDAGPQASAPPSTKSLGPPADLAAPAGSKEPRLPVFENGELVEEEPRARGELEKPPTAWTDPRVIAELAKNCAFRPAQLPWDRYDLPKSHWNQRPIRTALECRARFEQACVQDRCTYEDLEVCRPRCESVCDGCAGSCAAACESCKRTCHDDTCRTECAARCGSCRQDCLRSFDRCQTGGCGQKRAACEKRERENWNRAGCPQICRAYRRCEAACVKRHNGDVEEFYKTCIEPCWPKKTKVCNFESCPES